MAVKFAVRSIMAECRNVTQKTRNATPTLQLKLLEALLRREHLRAGVRVCRASASPGAGVQAQPALVWLGLILSCISGPDLPLFQPAGRYDHEKSLLYYGAPRIGWPNGNAIEV